MSIFLLAALALVTLLALIVNLPAFDEGLLPELVVLQTPQPISLEDNAHTLAFGFLAASERDPQLVGKRIIEALFARYEQAQSIVLSPDELTAILGESEEDWRSEYKSLDCHSRVYTDCAERLIAEVALKESESPRLSILLDRYETLLRQARFDEIQARDYFTQFPPYGRIENVQRLRMAISYRDDATSVFLAKVAQDFEFWLMVLRDSDTLATKMSAIGDLQNSLDFVSTLMRDRVLSDAEILTIEGFLRSFTDEESDIGEAWDSEARMLVLNDPQTLYPSWFSRLLLQENATLNQAYLTVFAPMQIRASLSAEDYYKEEGDKPLTFTLKMFPPPLYNLSGKLARKSNWETVQYYVPRVHDLNGRISLVLLQAEIAQSPDEEIEDIIRSSAHRNPYTGQPMEYDRRAQTLSFECMHTIFHPPAPPDVCSFPIGRSLN